MESNSAAMLASVAGNSGQPKRKKNPFAASDHWVVADGEIFTGGIPKTIPKLPPGVYKGTYHQMLGYGFKPIPLATDDMLSLPDTPSDEVVREVARFWTMEGEFRKRGLLFKRGVLLYGPPGSGKTATVISVAESVVERGGIAFFGDDPGTISACLHTMRKMDAESPIVCIMEDFEELIREDGEHGYLSLLDGEIQVDNIVYLATTNYLSRLPKRFTDRPSRFDLVKEVGMPSLAARKVYLKAKEPSLTESELNEWALSSEGFSIAHLRELIILCRSLPLLWRSADGCRQSPAEDDRPRETR